MSTTLTIRLDDKLDRALSRFARRTGRPKSEFAREALRRQLAVARFEEARARFPIWPSAGSGARALRT